MNHKILLILVLLPLSLTSQELPDSLYRQGECLYTDRAIELLKSTNLTYRDWRDGIDFSLRDMEAREVAVVLHHTYTNGKGVSYIRETLHRRQNGWPDAGYHVLVDWTGGVHWMSLLSEITYGVRMKNSYAIHICYLGNGHDRHITDEAIDSMQKVVWILKLVGIQVKEVTTHNRFARKQNPTDCPGRFGKVDLKRILE